MRLLPVLFSSILLTVPVALVAAPPEPEQIRRLVEELASSERTVRQAAMDRLLALGPEILPHLPAPELLPNEFVRGAVEQLRLELEQRAARQSVQGSQATLPAQGTLEELLAELGRQSGNRLDWSALPEETRRRRFVLAEPEGQFWPLLDRLAEQGGFALESGQEQHALRLIPRPEGEQPPARYSGAFRATLDRVELREPRAAGSPRLLRVHLSLWSEPRLRPLFFKFAGTDLRVNSGTETWPAFSPDASYDIPWADGGQRVNFAVNHVAPPQFMPDPQKPPLLSIEGTATMQVAAAMKEIAFPLLQPGIARRQAGVTVRLVALEDEPAQAGKHAGEISVRVSYDQGGPAFESHRSWILYNDVYLQDSDGTRYPLNDDYETLLEADGGVAVKYRFKQLPCPLSQMKFVYVAPTLLINVPIRFRFADVPLSGTVSPAPPPESK